MNSINIIKELLASGVEPKDAIAAANAHLKQRSQFFSKLRDAQQNLGKIIKNSKDQRGKNYAGVDQFVGQAKDALNQAGLTMFEQQTEVIQKGRTDRPIRAMQDMIKAGVRPEDATSTPTEYWIIECVLGDTQTGYCVPLQYEVPISAMALNKDPAQAVGSADSYALKYLTRGLLYAERADDDPDRLDDPDHKGYGDNKKKPSKPTPAASRKSTPKKPTSASRKKAVQSRVRAAEGVLGKETYGKVIAANSLSSLAEMEKTADVLDARVRLDQLQAKAEKKFGADQVTGWLELYRPFTIEQNIADGIKTLAEELNGGKKQ